MALTPGTRLGPYEVVAQIGAGGMGEVYRARDTRLQRDVAVKVLPAALSSDPDRLARFEQEARAAAALNHPNILSVFDLGSHGGAPYIVSELLEGSTLREQIPGLPVRKAVDYAIQIARGLAAAHDKGIVHRDLKPENIFLTSDGRVKILDFGLAKLTQAEPAAAGMSALPTTPAHAPQTIAGFVLGTVGYMAPEQVRGVAADHRADIFAFGTILYEMLSGRRAFQGETTMDTMTAILKEGPPDLPSAARHIPPGLTRIVDKCMEKTPTARFQSASDLAFALEALSESRSGPHPAESIPPMSATRIRMSWAVAAVAIVLVGAIGVTAGHYLWKASPPPATPMRLSFFRPTGTTLTNLGRPVLAISPDGNTVVFTSNYQLYRRRLDAVEAEPIAGTESTSLTTPFFSPDGKWIAYFSDGLKKIPVDGGVAVALGADQNTYGASWGDDDRIVYATLQGILRIPASGGTPEKIVSVKPGEAFHGPQMLPDGDHVLFTVTTAVGTDRWDKGQIVAQSIASGDRRILIQGGRDARYFSTGHLVYAVGDTIFAVAFDVSSLQVRGTPVTIQRGVRGTAGMTTGTAYFAVSHTGHLAYIPASTVTPATSALVDLDGRLERLTISVLYPRISPDGSQIAAASEGAIWIYPGLTNAAPRKLTFDGANDLPYWTPDGTRVTYRSVLRSGQAQVVLQRADGRGATEVLSVPDGFPFAWSRDQKTMYVARSLDSRGALWSLREGETPKQIVASDWEGSLSPDGEWMAYHITENRKTMTYIQSLTDANARFLISKGGGHHPLWSPDGKRLFFVENGGNHLMVVPVQTKPSVVFGNPTPLVDGIAQILNNRRNYDITPDGKRLLVQLIDEASNPRAQEVDVVLHWTEELKRLVPTN